MSTSVARRRLRAALTTTAFVAGALLASSTSGWAVENGNPVTAAEQEDRGLVRLNWNGTSSCSGVLIANDWLLTAGHCAVATRTNPAALTVSLTTPATPAPEAHTADAIYLFAGYADEVGPDLALVHTSAPFTIKGATSGFTNRIWPGGPETLVTAPTRTVATYGQGRVCPASPTAPSGVGMYRAADLQLAANHFEPDTLPGNENGPGLASVFHPADGGRYHQLLRNGSGQVVAPGDSGGPGFLWDNGTPYVVGINSGGGCGSTDAYQVSLPAVRDWVTAVLNTGWTPGSTGQNLWVLPAEVAGQNWPLSDVNTVGWAQAARSASALCYSRGYAGGHYDGHQGALDGRTGFGILCAAGDTAFFDLTLRDIGRQTWQITDLDKDSWAAAGRAAQEACGNRGYVGGQFTGHQRDNRWGLVCYKANAQAFDTTTADLANTGFAMAPDAPDATPWAQAARAATGVCRAIGKGYAGGFLNGHQIGNNLGVVCQK